MIRGCCNCSNALRIRDAATGSECLLCDISGLLLKEFKDVCTCNESTAQKLLVTRYGVKSEEKVALKESIYVPEDVKCTTVYHVAANSPYRRSEDAFCDAFLEVPQEEACDELELRFCVTTVERYVATAWVTAKDKEEAIDKVFCGEHDGYELGEFIEIEPGSVKVEQL